MVSQKFGGADPDLRSRVGSKAKTKEIADRQMPNPGQRTPYTGLVGGTGNGPRTSDAKKGPHMSYARGGTVSSGIAPYNEGGFRNAAMEHKR